MRLITAVFGIALSVAIAVESGSAHQELPAWPEDAELSVITLTSTGVYLSWDQASGVWGSPAYKLFRADDDCQHGEIESESNPLCLPIEEIKSYRQLSTFVALTPGEAYFFYIKACQGDGRTCTRDREDPTVIVRAPLDFAYRITAPKELRAVRNDFGTASIVVELLPGLDRPTAEVALRLSGLPSTGADGSFDPSSGTPTFRSGLTVSVSENTPLGTYPITVTADGGGVTASAELQLIVESGSDGMNGGGDGSGSGWIESPTAYAGIAIAILGLLFGTGWIGRRRRASGPGGHADPPSRRSGDGNGSSSS